MALRLLLLFAVLLFRSAAEPLAAENPPERVSAAASLREALDDVGREYRRLNGRQAVVTYAASSALAATDFLAFPGNPAAQAIWRRHGIVVLQ